MIYLCGVFRIWTHDDICFEQALPAFFAAIVLFYLALALLRVPFVVFASGAQLLAQMVSYTHAQT